MTSKLTSHERLRRLYFHEEMDRPAVIIRWWGFRDDPTASDLYKLMTEKADWVEPWVPGELLHYEHPPHVERPASAGGKQYPLKSVEDAERYLATPMPRIGGDVSGFFKAQEMVGERGIVAVHLGNNPGGQVAELFGSESFALMSALERELVHRLVHREQAIKLALLEFLIAQGVGPFFHIVGQEMIAPTLHSPADFFEFNVRYDRDISDRIHSAGGRLNVHCHGSVKKVLPMIRQMRPDGLHPVEGPPMGDVTLKEARELLGPEICMIGNIQIGDLYSDSVDEIDIDDLELVRTHQRGVGGRDCVSIVHHAWRCLDDKKHAERDRNQRKRHPTQERLSKKTIDQQIVQRPDRCDEKHHDDRDQ